MNIYIFNCNDRTEPDCFKLNLFGDKRRSLFVHTADPCLLWNFEKRVLYGIFEAKTDGGKNLKPDAFDGKFPYQVWVKQSSNTLVTVPGSKLGRMVNTFGVMPYKISGRLADLLFRYFQGIDKRQSEGTPEPPPTGRPDAHQSATPA